MAYIGSLLTGLPVGSFQYIGNNQFVLSLVQLGWRGRLPLCRYDIAPHEFDALFKRVTPATCRYAAMRLALIFHTSNQLA